MSLIAASWELISVCCSSRCCDVAWVAAKGKLKISKTVVELETYFVFHENSKVSITGLQHQCCTVHALVHPVTAIGSTDEDRRSRICTTTDYLSLEDRNHA
eukprot:124263-Rhodomonas_salina.3